MGNLNEIFSQLGITLSDEEGNSKTGYQVLEELSAIWDSLTLRQQNRIKEIFYNEK